MKLFIFALSMLCLPLFSNAQKPSQEPAIQLLNAKLNPTVKVVAKKKTTIEFYKNGSLFRDDTFHAYEVDSNSVRYSEEEKSLILECRSETPKCIYRNIYSSKLQGPYNRVAIEVKPEDAPQMISAIKYLCHLAQDKEFSEIFKPE